jgi:hypothetical protein
MSEEQATTNAAETETTATTEAAQTTEQANTAAASGGSETTAAAGGEQKTIAAGATEQKTETEAKPAWGDDWRQKMAEHASAGDKKAYERELKRLERFSDPTSVYGMYRELEAKFSQGGLVKIPGKDASEDDIKAFNKAIGVPEDPKAYVENLSLPNGVTLGDRDKTLAGDFAAALHKAGAPQSVMNEAMGWYLRNEEARAAEIDRQDDENKQAGTRELKEEWGASYNRNINAISSLFAYAPGGADMENEGALFNRLLGGRMADGRIIGDDPGMVKFLVSLAKEVNPVATVVESADGSGKGIDEEIADIEKLMRSDRRAYDKDLKKQARYLELLDARQKHRARA